VSRERDRNGGPVGSRVVRPAAVPPAVCPGRGRVPDRRWGVRVPRARDGFPVSRTGGRAPREHREKEARMSSGTETGGVTGTQDKDYNLIWYVEACLSNALRLDSYIQDAERAGDTEVADLFRKAQADSRKGAELGKDLLRARLGGGWRSGRPGPAVARCAHGRAFGVPGGRSAHVCYGRIRVQLGWLRAVHLRLFDRADGVAIVPLADSTLNGGSGGGC